MVVIRPVAWLLAMAMASPAAGQQVVEYTEDSSGPNELALGYPVPEPVPSLTPIEGFRAYELLHARHQALALEHDFIDGHRLGASIRGNGLFAYTISDPDGTTAAGFPEPAFQITGGTHAREWQSPEAVTGIMERFAERRHDRGLYEYLVDNANLVVIPVLNVDGFRQTQRFPARVILGADPENPGDAPRDGRMRRKNMRGADARLGSFGDHLSGVDLNRNNPPYAPSAQASGDPDSLLHHGGGAHTEPETQALADAVALGPVRELRLYTDFHSFAQAFFDPLTGNERQDGIQGRLINLARANLASQGTPYTRNSTPTAFGGIGSTDEFFAHVHQVPAWTLEIEPRFAAGGTQYGGFGVTHDGFILPESEVPRMREELANVYALLFYAQAGPPSVAAVEVLDAAGEVVWSGEWRRTGPGAREFVETARGGLVPGNDYRLRIAFDKPMRHRDATGTVANYPGTNGGLEPEIRLEGSTQEIAFITAGGRWLAEPDTPGRPGYGRYRDDAYMASLSVPDTLQPGEGETLTLHVDTADMASIALDADPATRADWDGGHWVGYESSDGTPGDVGGTDTTIEIPLLKEQPARVKLTAGSAGAIEGARVGVRLERDDTAGALTVELTAEQVVSDPEPRVSRLFETSVAFGPRGDAVKDIAFAMPDDLTVLDAAADAEVRVSAAVTEGTASVAEPSTVTVELVDNDGPGRLVTNVLDPLEAPLPPDVSPLPPGLALGDRLAGLLERAQDAASPVTINLADGAIYALNATRGGTADGFPAITGEVTIEGRDSVIRRHSDEASPAPAFRLFRVAPEGRLNLVGVSLEGGAGVGNRPGGALLNEGHLLADRVVFRGNAANRAGALANLGTAELVRSAFLENRSPSGGGAVFNRGDLALDGVTLSGNRTEGRGGAILNPGNLEMHGATLVDNRGRSGADLVNAGRAVVGGSVLASPDSCVLESGTSTRSDGFNFNGDGSCALSSGSDRNAGDALLGPLNDEGVHVPAQDSPLVGVVPPDVAHCGGSDARGAPRPFSSPGPFIPSEACEIGAAERAPVVHRGLWLNPERPGHGIDVQQVRNVLIVTWFTYDAGGDPVWYQAAEAFSHPTWQGELRRFTFDHGAGEATGSVVGEITLSFESDAEANFHWDLTPIGRGSGAEPFEPLTVGRGEPRFDTTGLWAAADGSDWGLTVDVQGEVNVATVYYYDAEGNPRWVQGSGPGGLDARFDLDSFSGFCPGCDMQAMPVRTTPAGNMNLRFVTRRHAVIDTDFVYPGSQGGAWRRRVELDTLSDPVP